MSDNEAATERFNNFKELKEKHEKGEEIDEANQELLNAEPAPTLPEFDSKETEEKFDQENPEIEIPAEVVTELDNDWVLTEFEVDTLI